MPKAEPGDPIFGALTSRGLQVPAHTSEVGSNLASDKHYDQIAFFPGPTRDCFRQMGVFDFDAVVFKTLPIAQPVGACAPALLLKRLAGRGCNARRIARLPDRFADSLRRRRRRATSRRSRGRR